MNIPSLYDPCWTVALLDSWRLEGCSLGTRMLVARLRVQVRNVPASMPEAVALLHGYFNTNPAVRDDLPDVIRRAA
ncbi:hypothetical protein [Pseudooceanicola sp. HF7]|uniref:hypothetical protein n=1 Tax=Pseudooceanicola sp. HF7 TaxID=2721560 RepID=UPI0014319EB4|nr:hypothetical protein [Pseudooceanicola sp. HF7]NIZ10454.1 hypothetical protein [Pseudooceanicola sp. HF7]